MLKALMRVRMAALKSWLTGSMRSKKGSSKGKMVLFAALMLYVVVVFAVMFYNLFGAIAGVFYASGISWLYFTMFAMLAFALMFIGSVFMAKAQLFEAKDNELLLSMPIKPNSILLSRMLTLIIMDVVAELVVAVPAGFAWVKNCPLNAVGAVSFIAICVVLPLFAMAFSALFGWLISLATSKVRNKSLMSTVFSLIFLAIYFYGYSKIAGAVNSLIANGTEIAESIGAIAPLYWLGSAVADGNILYLLAVCAICLIAFAVAYCLLSATFIKTVTTNRGTSKIKYQEKEQKVSSASSALYRRELRRFLSSSPYILNASLGILVIVVAAVAAIIKRNDILPLMEQLVPVKELLLPIALAMVCMVVSTTIISAPSVSMEGKNLWIVRSLPVSTKDILLAKLRLHNNLSVSSALLASAVVIFIFKPTGIMLACTIILPAVFAVFIGLVGLAANLKFPNLDWVNETQAVKNGISILITMFGGWAAVLVPVALVYFLRTHISALEYIVFGYTVILLIVCRVLRGWIITKGAKIFEEL